jgi:transcriptional regulator with XRE-family HTH domain
VQLATVSGIEQANISAIETGRRVPSAATLHRLLHACGFELTASAGEQEIACPPPGDDLFFGALLERGVEELPIVSRDTPMATRVRVLTGVLDAAEAIVRGR